MITKPELGILIEPLEKRFKALSPEQADVYHDLLKYQDKEVLEKACEQLSEDAERFPTPGRIKSACREIKHHMSKTGHHISSIRPSCQRCREGYIKFARTMTRKDGSTYQCNESRPCAHCNTEPNGLPHYTQINDQIYMASRRIDGSVMWIPDLNNRTIQLDFEPRFTNETLESYYADETGKAYKKPVTDLSKLKSIIPPKSMEYING